MSVSFFKILQVNGSLTCTLEVSYNSLHRSSKHSKASTILNGSRLPRSNRKGLISWYVLKWNSTSRKTVNGGPEMTIKRRISHAAADQPARSSLFFISTLTREEDSVSFCQNWIRLLCELPANLLTKKLKYVHVHQGTAIIANEFLQRVYLLFSCNLRGKRYSAIVFVEFENSQGVNYLGNPWKLYTIVFAASFIRLTYQKFLSVLKDSW